jgi:hypothetical protein
MPKLVAIKEKLGKPTLHEVCERLDIMFQNMEYRGEDKLNIVLAALSFCISQLNDQFDDKEVANLVVDCLNMPIKQYLVNIVNYCQKSMTVKNMIRIGFS